LVLGTAQLGLAYGAANHRGQPDERQARLIVTAAINAGVCWLDTAAAYGTSEARIGAYVPMGSPARVVTKLAPLDEMRDETPIAEVLRAVDESVRRSCYRLRTDRLDALLLHRARHLTWREGAIWRRLKMLRDSGAILDLGVSVYTPEEALAALRDSDVRHIQLPFNLLDWRWREAGVIAALKTRTDVTVHARSIFLQGLLAANDPAIWPHIEGVNPQIILKLAGGLAEEFGRESIADLCLAYARGQDFIDGVVIGLETEEQLDTNLRLAVKSPLTKAEGALAEARIPRLPPALLDPAQWPKS
jgi:spore coat polysaccharide biosynthesis protein SpsF